MVNSSKISNEWLDYISKSKNIKLKREYKIKRTNYYVDGYDKNNKTIYEFHGDYWHGNPNIYNPDQINNRTNKRTRKRYISKP